MTDRLAGAEISVGQAEAGVRAAEQLWRDGLGVVEEPEVASPAFANAALDRLTVLERNRSAVDRAIAEGSERAARSLSDDPLQGLAEIVQNADDLGASGVRFALVERLDGWHLLACHDGAPVALDHVVAMAWPWITTKTSDVGATGRFGIGLKTLNVLGAPLHVHSSPYHFSIEDQTLRSIEPAEAVAGLYNPERRDTLLDLRLGAPLDRVQVAVWLEETSCEGLLFLRHVRVIELLAGAAHDAEESPEGIAPGVRIGLHEVRKITAPLLLGEDVLVTEMVTFSADESHYGEPREWLRLTVDVEVPSGLHRENKATGATTPISIALPTEPGGIPRQNEGRIHAALPLAQTGLPFSINAQYDPDAGRKSLLQRPWNSWLLRETGRLIAAFAVDRLAVGDPFAWRVVPVESDLEGASSTALAAVLREQLLGPAQTSLHNLARLPTGDPRNGLAPLDDVTYEVPELTGLVGPREVRELVGDQALVLDDGQRDSAGRWRKVLADLDLGPALTIESSLALFELTGESRSPEFYANLASLALDSPALASLASHRCVVLADFTRVKPPNRSDAQVLVEDVDPGALSARLGLALRVHPEYLASCSEPLLEWLRNRGAFGEHSTALSLVQSLGRLPIAIELSAADLRDLRDAFDRLSDVQRRAHGPLVGARILVPGRVAEAGRWRSIKVAPAAAYLPSGLEHVKGSWAAAAGKAEGLHWLATELEGVLQGGGRESSGAARFLRVLGATSAPRLIDPPDASIHFQRTPIRVVDTQATRRPEFQRVQLRALAVSGQYLRGDHASPDLAVVCRDIAAAPRKERNRRAQALLASLSRAWDRDLAEHSTADVVQGYNGYYEDQGQVVATWVAEAASIAWFPAVRGPARRPMDLTVRTQATELVHGSDPTGFAVQAVLADAKPEVLRALGLRGDPTASALVDKLRTLRDDELGAPHTSDAGDESILAYRLLARHARARRETGPQRLDDMSVARLRVAFAAGSGLIRTDGAWHRPDQVLRGRAIFGARRVFAPDGFDLGLLWKVLGVREPSIDDCVAVLRDIARRGPLRSRDEGVLLETFERLAEIAPNVAAEALRPLANLPLWSGAQWLRTRPVVAIDDATIASALTPDRPVWHPPGPLSRYAGLLEHLRVAPLDAAQLETTDLDVGGSYVAAALKGDPLRGQFALTAMRLAAELPRSDLTLFRSGRLDLTTLASAPVLVIPGLAVRVPHPAGQINVPVRAHVRLHPPAWLIADEDAGGAEDGVGRAVGRLFEGDRQKVAWAWTALWHQAAPRTRVPAAPTLSSGTEDSADDDSELEQAVRTAAARSKQRPASGNEGVLGTAKEGTTSNSPPASRLEPRRLKDPDAVVISQAELIRPGAEPLGISVPESRGLRDLGEARNAARTPRGERSPGAPIEYEGREREQLGLAVLRQVLEKDSDGLRDVSALRGVGADALDDQNRPFELKAFARQMPDAVSLTRNEAQRASETPGFCLVIVDGLEEGQPTRVLVVVDPVNALQLRFDGAISLAGLHERLGQAVTRSGPEDVGDV